MHNPSPPSPHIPIQPPALELGETAPYSSEVCKAAAWSLGHIATGGKAHMDLVMDVVGDHLRSLVGSPAREVRADRSAFVSTDLCVSLCTKLCFDVIFVIVIYLNCCLSKCTVTVIHSTCFLAPRHSHAYTSTHYTCTRTPKPSQYPLSHAYKPTYPYYTPGTSSHRLTLPLISTAKLLVTLIA